jgi:hypothetical protein
LYWEQIGYNIPKKEWNQESFTQAVRFGNWKAVRPPRGGAVELYDLGVDPSESRNLAAEKPELVKRAEGYMKEAHTPPRSHADGSSQWVV